MTVGKKEGGLFTPPPPPAGVLTMLPGRTPPGHAPEKELPLECTWDAEEAEPVEMGPTEFGSPAGKTVPHMRHLAGIKAGPLPGDPTWTLRPNNRGSGETKRYRRSLCEEQPPEIERW